MGDTDESGDVREMKCYEKCLDEDIVTLGDFMIATISYETFGKTIGQVQRERTLIQNAIEGRTE